MSASNWAECPRCKRRAQKAYDVAVKALAESYGKVPAAEYEAARDSLALGPVGREFREDYEIYGADEGVVIVDYHGHCSKCGLELSFKETKPIEGVDE